MASSTTTNYKLNQWAATDKILMTEVNNDNKLIDDALAKKLDKTATAASATTASKLGTATVGSATVPIYLDAGAPKAVNKVAAAGKADSATSATTATKLGTATVGNATTPIYLNAGAPTACSALATAAQMTALTNRVAALEGLTVTTIAAEKVTGNPVKQNVVTFNMQISDLSKYKVIILYATACQRPSVGDLAIVPFSLSFAPAIFTNYANYIFDVFFEEYIDTKTTYTMHSVFVSKPDPGSQLILTMDPVQHDAGTTNGTYEFAPVGFASMSYTEIRTMQSNWGKLTEYQHDLKLILMK